MTSTFRQLLALLVLGGGCAAKTPPVAPDIAQPLATVHPDPKDAKEAKLAVSPAHALARPSPAVLRRDALGNQSCTLTSAHLLSCSKRQDLPGVVDFQLVGNDALCALDSDGRALFAEDGGPLEPVRIDTPAVQVAHAGHGTCCVLTADGSVYCVGRRYFEADRPRVARAEAPLHLELPPINQLSYGAYALSDTGEVWLLLDTSGQLPLERRFLPRPVRGPGPGVTAITYTRSGPCTLQEDGTIVCYPVTATWKVDNWGTGVHVDLPPALAFQRGLDPCARLADDSVRCW